MPGIIPEGVAEERLKSAGEAKAEEKQNAAHGCPRLTVMTKKQMKEFKEAFALFDKDSSGAISFDELMLAMKSLGSNPTEEEIRNMITEVDEDGNEEIDFEEFVQMMNATELTCDTVEGIKEAFALFDQNGTGCIDGKDLKAVMEALGETLTDEEASAMLKVADSDGDGVIKFEEFEAMMT